MSQFLHDANNTDAKAIAIPPVFSENSRAKKRNHHGNQILNFFNGIFKMPLRIIPKNDSKLRLCGKRLTLYQKNYSTFSLNVFNSFPRQILFNLSANAFSLVMFKILSFGTELNNIMIYLPHPTAKALLVVYHRNACVRCPHFETLYISLRPLFGL